MLFRDAPIQRKLTTIILLTCGAVLLLTCSAYFVYEYITFRQDTIKKLSSLGYIITVNSTAFKPEGREDAIRLLSALKADPHIVAAGFYDEQGNLFARYPQTMPVRDFPAKAQPDGFTFGDSFLSGYQPIFQQGKRAGSLYIKSDLRSIYERFELYGIIAFSVVSLSSIVAFFLSRQLQHSISKPVMALAETAKTISAVGDYSVRATKLSNDELGELTDAFNQMLQRIQEQTHEITSFNQSLERKVADRTIELETANKELEAFSYSVSHDLRAPLRSIHGYMNIFAEEYASQFDEEGRRLIDIILKNGHRMGQLIDDLLEFSKLGRRELIRSIISIEDIVKNIWNEQVKIEGDRSIQLTLLPLPNAMADSATMRQVWFNLISNALKYTKQRKETVIEIGSFEKDQDVVYYIKDNGAGFNMQYYDKLFGVFQRLHSVKEFEGTGVGLAIVQRIIAKHGGTVWADAKPGEGAAFYFSVTKVSASLVWTKE